jgi:hypothetical protein
MRSRALVASLLLLAPRAALAQSPIEIVGRSGATRVPDDAGVEAASGPRECPTESWTFEVTLPNATINTPTVWAAAGFSCSLGERSQPNATCFELCGASRNVCTGSLAAGTNRYRFTIPTRWLVDPANGQCVASGGRRAVFLIIDGEVVALSPRRVRYDLLPPAPPREVDLTNFEDRVEVRWSYGSTGTAATDAGTTTDVVDAGSDVVDAGPVDAGPSTATGGEETVSRFYVLCDPPTTQDPVAMDAGTCGTGALSALDLTRDDLLARHRCADETGPHGARHEPRAGAPRGELSGRRGGRRPRGQPLPRGPRGALRLGEPRDGLLGDVPRRGRRGRARDVRRAPRGRTGRGGMGAGSGGGARGVAAAQGVTLARRGRRRYRAS